MPGVHTFTVYKTAACSYCQQAVQFLDALRQSRDDVQVRLVDANAEPAAFQTVARAVGRATVPQIFVDGAYVGGWNELARAASNGRLDAFLEGRPWHAPVRRRGLFGRRA